MTTETLTNKLTIKSFFSLFASSTRRLKRVLKSLQRALFFSPFDTMLLPAKNISLSIEKGRLSVVFGTRFLSSISIKGTKEFQFEEGRFPQPEEVASSLVIASNEFSAKNAGVTLSIPKAWAILKTVDFPSVVKENLSDVVSYEMDRLTPFTADEAFYDFRIAKEGTEKISLLLAVAKADVLKPYLKAIEDNGFRAGRITVNLSGIGTLCYYIDRKPSFLFVETDGNEYTFAIVERGIVAHQSSGALIAADETQRAGAFIQEISSRADTAKRQGISNLQVIAIFRKSAVLFKDQFRRNIPLPVRILGEPGTRLGIPDSGNEIPFAAAGSMLQSLWPKAESIDLLSKGIHEQRKIPVAATVFLVLALASVWVFYLLAPLRVEEKRLQAISMQLRGKKEEVRKVEALKKEGDNVEVELNQITLFKEGRPMAISLMKELTEVLPKTAWLLRVRITDTTLEIEGYAQSATEILPKLETSKLFKKAEFSSPTYRDIRQNADKFNIKMEIVGVRKPDTTKKDTGAPQEGPKSGKK